MKIGEENRALELGARSLNLMNRPISFGNRMNVYAIKDLH